MKKAIKYIIMFLLLGLLIFVYLNKSYIFDKIINTFFLNTEVQFNTKNEYTLGYKFDYIENVTEFDLKNRQDLLNLYFTVINNGITNFEFYCPQDYDSCLNDVIYLAEDQRELSYINGYVHPFNSFDTIQTSYDSWGRVKLKVIRTYTDVEITELNKKVLDVIQSEVKNETDSKKKIKIIHDYIINNARYDKDRTDNYIIKYASNTAYGALLEGYAICSGYADAMKLFLDYFKIPNYKIVSENHVWNAVYLDGNWYHLDLTWDDPIMDNGSDALFHDYFLISSKKLKELNDNQHNYDEKVFTEFK